MTPLKVRFKRLTPDAVAPKLLNKSNGLVLVATSKIFDKHGNAVYSTGISVDIPQGYIGLLLPLSSNFRKDLLLSSYVGTIEPGNTEEIVFRFRPAAFFTNECKDDEMEGEGTETNTFDYICFGKEYIEDNDITNVYSIGDRVGQLLIVPRPAVELEEVLEMTEGTFSNEIPYQGPINL